MRPVAHRTIFLSLALSCVAGAWWGCANGSKESTTGGLGGSSSGGGGSGTGNTGGIVVPDGGQGGGGEGGSCSSTSKKAHPVPLDLIFLVDRSDSMSGSKWMGTTSALTAFFSDPGSAAIGAGLQLFPTTTPKDCDVQHYEVLLVPIAPLPGNAFDLTNALPADANVYSTPMYGALQGVLMVATAYQDAHPTHKVAVVLATDCNSGIAGEPGDPTVCNGKTFDDIAALAAGALSYNGVHTYVIGVEGADLDKLNHIAASGGTTAAYDVTQDISQFAAKMAEIRNDALGCQFQIPDPPDGKMLDPAKVNFSYTPGGMGMPDELPRVHDGSACGSEPGWYYDSNSQPTEIILCPASCSTVENDDKAEVNVLFGCKSIIR
ncbi:MAG TPA: VWA domain-containing protein [Minicystis sp.]|nr:VWA domain-containing protein [Minicystis sp.]